MLVAVTLAGCAEEQVAEPEDEFSEDLGLEATDSTGIIRGVVVDQSIVPLADAKIELKGQDKETVSNENGEFGFADLEPGNYFLSVSKLGFGKVQQSVSVEAGVDKPPVVRILLESDPSSMPYTEIVVFEGYLQCGAGIGGVGSTNPCALADSVNTFDSYVNDGLNMTQLEMVWKGTNVLGDGLSIGILRPGTLSNFVNSDGPSPRILPVSGALLEEEHGEGYESYLIRVFPGTSQPLSLVVEQRFTIYDTHFYGFAADEGWSFVEDGEHPIPGL